jgi:hypothetical protein
MAKKVRTMQGKTLDFDEVKRKNKNAIPLGVKAVDKDVTKKKVKMTPAQVTMHTLSPKRNVPDISIIQQQIKDNTPERVTVSTDMDSLVVESSEATKAPRGKK